MNKLIDIKLIIAAMAQISMYSLYLYNINE